MTARLRLPRQDAYGADRVRYFDEVMTFRHRENGVAEEDTAGIERIPA